MNLTINQLSFRYFVQKPILSQFSYTFESGKITAITGPSGIGKSTLLQLILGFLKPDEGTIHLGESLLSSPTSMIVPEKRGIGAVFQDYALFPHLSVYQNIAFGLKGSLREKHKLVLEMASFFQLTDLLSAYPYRLSGGQMQRVAFARSLAPCPRVLLLDEPFSHLDEALTDSLRTALKTFLKDKKITTIVITHDPLDVQHFADTLVEMK